MAEESAVKVCVRVRPLIAREQRISEGADPVPLYWRADEKSIHQIDDGNGTKSFSFDRVFCAAETTNQLYQDFAKPLVVSTVEGYNGTIFAYGQTSSGKTFTMMGSDHSPGVIPLAVEDVFQTIHNCPTKEFLLRVSYMEIYNETVNDLLVDGWKRKPLEVREAINKTIYVADLTEELVTSPAQALAWIRKGEKSRHYEKTKMNQRSSRSHTIFRMILESRERSENSDGAIIVSHLNLVDLAGSERASQTGAEGTRFKEGCNINLSLFTLGQVIKKLAENQKGFTNYRDSKLTRILQNSLGGNAKTVIICTITPVALDETLGTLQFASAAKKMKNDPHVTEVSDDGALLKRYRNEIADLKKRLHEVSTVTHTTATEKQLLSQLLQEKDQLQREQQDKIKNLTKLLVTSSTSIAVNRIPRRRVTWGGKMLKLCVPGSSDGSPTEHSFIDTTNLKSEASCSALMEADEDEFDSRWGIPDDPPDDLDMSSTAITIRSYGERLDGRVAELEMQLRTQEQEKQESLNKLQEWEQKAAMLEQQARSEVQQKQEAVEKMEMLELKVTELECRLDHQMEADQQTRKEFAETLQICESLASEKDTVVTELDYVKQELAMFAEQTESLERENAALSQQLKDKNELDEFEALEDQARKEHQDELHSEISLLKAAAESSERQHLELKQKYGALCEELKRKTELVHDLEGMNDKDLVQEVVNLRRSLDDAEGLSRDAKKEWAMLRSRNTTLEEMKVTLSADHEKMQAEVTSLRSQLDAEKSRYKKMQTDLQKELNVAFDENSKLSTLLDGKVPRNLMDSVELERTVRSLRKELAASQEAELTLRAQLEQLGELPAKVDALMKELHELNEKLCGVEAQRDALLAEQVTSREVNERIQSGLDVAQESLLKAEEERSVTEQREQDLIQQHAETVQQLESLNANLVRSDAEKNLQLTTIAEMNVKIEHLTEELLQRGNDGSECSSEEKDQLLSTVAALTEERDQLKMDMQENVEMMIENQGELRVALDTISAQKENIKQLQAALTQTAGRDAEMSAQHQQLVSQVKALQEELDQVQAERESLLRDQSAEAVREEMVSLMNRHASVTEEKEQLLESLECLRQEKRQLREELEETIEKMAMMPSVVSEEKSQLETELRNQIEKASENQRLLQSVQEQLAEQIEKNSELERLAEERRAQLDQQVTQNAAQASLAQENVRGLEEELNRLRAEKTELESRHVSQENTDNLMELHQQVQSLSAELEHVRAERDSMQVGGTVEAHREENENLQNRLASLAVEREQLLESLEGLKQEKRQLAEELEETMAGYQLEVTELKVSLQNLTEQKTKLEDNLQKSTSEASRTQEHLTSVQEELLSQERTMTTQVCTLERQIQTLRDKLEVAEAERDRMVMEEDNSEEMEMIQRRVVDVTEERDQLLETLETLRQEKRQLRDELEETTAALQAEVTELKVSLQNLTEQKTKLEDNLQKSTSEASRTQEHLTSVQEELLSQERTMTTQVCTLERQIQTLRDELEVAEAERDRVVMEEDNSEEMEMIQRRVVAVTEERDQLLETLETLRQEKRQLRDELEETTAALQAEVSELKVSLQNLTEQKTQLEDNLQKSASEASRTQELLASVQEELLSQERTMTTQVCTLEQQIQTLRDKLEVAEAERDRVVMEEDNSEEMEMIQRRVVAVTEERDQLLETLETLRQEKRQLRDELEETTAALQAEVKTLAEKLRDVAEKEDLLLEKEHHCQTLREEAKALQHETLTATGSTHRSQIDTLSEQLRVVADEKDFLLREIQTRREETEELHSRLISLTEEKDHLQNHVDQLGQEKMMLAVEKEETLHMLSGIQQKLCTLEQQKVESEEAENRLQHEVQLLKEELRCREVAEAGTSQQSLPEAPTVDKASVRLHNSTAQLQELFAEFQRFNDGCCKSSALVDRRVEWILEPSELPHVPKSYIIAMDLGQKTLRNTDHIIENIYMCAKRYRHQLEALLLNDLAVFEEQRLQDVLMCRAQAPSFSVKVEDLSAVWERRLAVTVDNRLSHMQTIRILLERLWVHLSSHTTLVTAENGEREQYKKELRDPCTNKVPEPVALEHILDCEMQRRTEVTERTKVMLKDLLEELTTERNKMRKLIDQGEARLKEERSKRFTLQEALGGAELKTEVSLLKDNRQLVLSLQEAQERIKALGKEVDDMQIQASDRLSNHKQATQLLQTELQDSRALTEEKEHMIQNLKSKLRESEENADPSAAELQDLRNKVLKLEMEMSAASDKHQLQLQRMTTVLSTKEASLRKLRETLRQSHQEGEDSFQQGKDLHARLVNPRGAVFTSSIQTDKVKLQEEVKRLKCRITELESSLSNQTAEVSKWKGRALKLKTKVDKPSSQGPLTPTKRALPDTFNSVLNSPKKLNLSPNKLLDSPKKLASSPRTAVITSPLSNPFSGLPSRAHPKRFFDNSGLGDIPDLQSQTDGKEEWWPQSPKQEDLCKTQ
ncbi:centromere-associated protein E isoform X1 [Synchiropus splendidus]|uniref:centromere-associated protein E isoform X1 n=1 Tax=Synchiropus splendidus TaxID=270530 RepID=UPI00237D9F65|nr:centromere-associated protein E isoform X1 [Synchiropus splendidus]